jgi:oligoribonuclease
MPLDFYAGPLVWVDCEMTGLTPRKDKILEIAASIFAYLGPGLSLTGAIYTTQVLITNGNLELVDEGIHFVIQTEKQDLDR